jgi:hypothetical protein
LIKIVTPGSLLHRAGLGGAVGVGSHTMAVSVNVVFFLLIFNDHFAKNGPKIVSSLGFRFAFSPLALRLLLRSLLGLVLVS